MQRKEANWQMDCLQANQFLASTANKYLGTFAKTDNIMSRTFLLL
jgi:hypothetical protein